MIPTAWREQSALYRLFCIDPQLCDFSEEAAAGQYQYETFGGVNPLGIFSDGKPNGYALGKRWLNLQITAWKRDIAQGWLTKQELLSDPTLPHPWVDHLIKDWPAGTHQLAQVQEDVR